MRGSSVQIRHVALTNRLVRMPRSTSKLQSFLMKSGVLSLLHDLVRHLKSSIDYISHSLLSSTRRRRHGIS